MMFILHRCCIDDLSQLLEKQNQVKMFPPGLEPGTFRVLGERDNHYTTETCILELFPRL